MMKSENKRRAKAKPAPVKKPPAWPEKQEASEAQLGEMASALERKAKRRAPVPVKARKTEAGVLQAGGTLTDESIHHERLLDVCGTRSDDWMNGLILAIANAGCTKSDGASTLSEGLAFLNGVGPRDEVEAALAAQMFAVHRASMTAAQRMGSAEVRDVYRDYGNLLVKTTRTFAAQVEALAKLRNGGKQQVEVRYVYVDARGGQNIIASDLGGRSVQQNGQQPHGSSEIPGLPFAPGVPVWGPEQGGHALPSTGDAREEAVPAARGQESGSAKG